MGEGFDGAGVGNDGIHPSCGTCAARGRPRARLRQLAEENFRKAFDHGPIRGGCVVQNLLKFIELSGLLYKSVYRYFQVFQRKHVASERGLYTAGEPSRVR